MYDDLAARLWRNVAAEARAAKAMDSRMNKKVWILLWRRLLRMRTPNVAIISVKTFRGELF